jgi:phytoene dehydrogenase-like protein
MPGDLPDVVFIGAGINALGAAYLLSQAGWRVLVVDRNNEPGGAVRTLELTLPGFRHDIGAMNLNLVAGSPFFQQHRDALARKGLELVTADHAVGTVFPGDRFLGITTDQDATLRAIARFSKADAEAWRTWLADFDACKPFLFRIFGAPAPAAAPLAYAFGDETNVPEPIQPALRGILLDSLRANLSARFESEEMRAVIAAWGLHPDYAPDIAGGCWYPFLETNIDQRQGIAIAKGGSGRVTHALADLIREAGGEVRTGASVDKIVIENVRPWHIAGAPKYYRRAPRKDTE